MGKVAIFHGRTKHIAVRHHFIRETVEAGDIKTARVDTKDNLADILTKSPPRFTFEDLTKRMGMVDAEDDVSGGVTNRVD